MKSAKEALQQLLADIESAQAVKIGNRLSIAISLDYLERLARDGLAAEAKRPCSPWIPAPQNWACTHESDCDAEAVWADGYCEGACDEHAAEMGVFVH